MDEKSFWSHVDKSGNCWIWKGQKTDKGYGRFGSKRAHRISYELANGKIPDGLMVCHNCPSGDNPACVNPSHLFLGTNSDNQKDSYRKGRKSNLLPHPIGENHPSSKLKQTQVDSIRSERKSGYKITYLSKKFCVGATTIWKIIHNQTWNH